MSCQSELPGSGLPGSLTSCYVSVSVRLFSSRSHDTEKKPAKRTHELMNKLNWRLTDRETKRRLGDKVTDKA